MNNEITPQPPITVGHAGWSPDYITSNSQGEMLLGTTLVQTSFEAQSRDEVIEKLCKKVFGATPVYRDDVEIESDLDVDVDMPNDSTNTTGSDCPSATCSPPDWERVKWRQLQAGELVERGDWVDMAPDGWRDDPKWVPVTKIGEAAPDPAYPSHRIFRRVLEANSQDQPPAVEGGTNE